MTKRKALFLACACALSSNATATQTNNWSDKLAFSAAVEVEAAYADASDWDSNKSTSDIVLATVELGLDVALIENVSAHIVTLYKQDDIDFDIHQGFFQFEKLGGYEGLNAKLGRMYLPFGQLETHMVNDTLGMELISPQESLGFRQSAAQLGWTTGLLSVDAYVFNGDGEIDGSGEEVDTVSDFGISANLGNDTMNIRIDYLNNVVSSAVIQDELGEANDKLAAISINGMVQLSNVSVLAEYIKLDKLSDAGYIISDQPTVAQIDAGYDFGNGWSAGLAWQATDEAQVLGFPETRLTAGIATSIYKDAISVGLELWRDSDYDQNDGGSDDTINGLTLQFAAEF